MVDKQLDPVLRVLDVVIIMLVGVDTLAERALKAGYIQQATANKIYEALGAVNAAHTAVQIERDAKDS